MDKIVKIGLFVFVVVVALSYVFVKPLVYNDNEYKVVIANTSEHTVSEVVITGEGIKSGAIGPILVGYIQDFIFTPEQDTVLRYTIIQNKQKIEGVINHHLKQGDTGKIYLVIREMYKVEVHDEFDT